MDTRAKIVNGPSCAGRLAELRRDFPALRVVWGVFDPVLAGHARRLEGAREGADALAVVVLDPPDPILPARARAELVAALSSVDAVFLPEGQAPPEAEANFESQDLEDRARFTAHVLERQS